MGIVETTRTINPGDTKETLSSLSDLLTEISDLEDRLNAGEEGGFMRLGERQGLAGDRIDIYRAAHEYAMKSVISVAAPFISAMLGVLVAFILSCCLYR